MAIEILDPKIKVVIHHAGHDLESFYWVLLWIVLRHTAHDHEMGSLACETVFPLNHDSEATVKKRGTLQGHRLEIIDNEPLSELLERFKELVDDATTLKMHRRKPLTYDAVLSIFDEALMREDWPEGDAALPFVLESTRTASVYGPKHPKIRSRAPNHPKRSRIEDVLEAEHTDLDSETLASQSSHPSTKRRRHTRMVASAPEAVRATRAASSTMVASGSTRNRSNSSMRVKRPHGEKAQGSRSSCKASGT